MSFSHAKMRLESAPIKVNFVMTKAISNSYTNIVSPNALARSRIVTDRNTALFSIKITLCEINNILFSKNY